MNRLSQIARCMAELELIEREFDSTEDKLMPLLGQMDWLTELHGLLHEFNYVKY